MKRICLGVWAVLAWAAPLRAAPPTIFNTGVDGSGDVVGNGTPDGHFVVNNFGPPTVNSALSATPPADTGGQPGSAWDVISSRGAGAYDFFQNFTLTDPATMTVTGQWSAFGDGLFIALDSTVDSTDITPTPGNGGWTQFSITGPVTSGTNFIEFAVSQDLTAGPDPGLRVEITSVAVPEPAPAALLGLSAFALLARRRHY